MSAKCKKLKETLVNALAEIDQEEDQDQNNDIRIVILQRGWVVVGRYKRVDQYVTLDDVFVIRAWGTTKGLGEIAQNGPISGKTILDASPQFEFHTLVEVANIKCNFQKWKETCK